MKTRFSTVTSCGNERNNICSDARRLSCFFQQQAFRVSKPLGLERERVGLKREIMDLLLMKAGGENESVEKYKM